MPDVPEASRQPRHRQIADKLYAAIQAGEYVPGDRLPGENDLIREHQVTRNTAREALGVLKSWGLTETRKGSGVYVRDFKPIVRDGIRRLSSETWPTGKSIWADESADRNLGVDHIEVSTLNPPDHIREMLGLQTDETTVMRFRRFLIDGKPVMVARSWLPAAIAEGTAIATEDTGPGGTYARLRDLGRAPVKFREDLRVRLLPELDKDAKLLELVAPAPVTDIIRTAFDEAGTPVEVNEMTADANAYVFRYEFNG